MAHDLVGVLSKYQPQFPKDYQPGVAIIGCGKIVQLQHLPAYKKYRVKVVGVFDILPDVAEQVRSTFEIPKVYRTLEDLLEDPRVEVVDIATHPDVRFPLVQQAIEAGKHVLVQKPLAMTVEEAKRIIEMASQKGVKVAVNQNGRWAPPWRVATLLIEQGVLGEVFAITHLFETSFKWTIGTKFDQIRQWLLYDYAIHWIDISRCWMGSTPVEWVRAENYRLSLQPEESKTPWGAIVEIRWQGGKTAVIRSVGGAQVTTRNHPFWIHGTEGTLRGSVMNREWIELEQNHTVTQFHLEGSWYPDGFGGTIGELFSSIVEHREPFNSPSHNLLSLQLTLAACTSADREGERITLDSLTELSNTR